MVTMNKSYKFTLMLVSVVGVLALSVGITNEFKRRSLVRYQNDVIASLSAEIDVYKSLGFEEQDRVIEVTKSRIAYAQEKLESLKSNSQVIFKRDQEHTAKREKIENLLRINKEMVASHREEIQEYKKLGLKDSEKPVRLVKENLAKLVVEIADLERKLEIVDSDQMVTNEAQEKMNKLIALNKDSLELYKNELVEYTKLGLADQDPKMRYVRDRIANKNAEIESLEKHLQQI